MAKKVFNSEEPLTDADLNMLLQEEDVADVLRSADIDTATITNNDNKIPSSKSILTALSKKVDKESGKSLFSGYYFDLIGRPFSDAYYYSNSKCETLVFSIHENGDFNSFKSIAIQWGTIKTKLGQGLTTVNFYYPYQNYKAFCGLASRSSVSTECSVESLNSTNFKIYNSSGLENDINWITIGVGQF